MSARVMNNDHSFYSTDAYQQQENAQNKSSKALNTYEIQSISNNRRLQGQTMKEVVTNAMVNNQDYDSVKIFNEQNKGGARGKQVKNTQNISVRDTKNNLGLGDPMVKYSPGIRKPKVASMSEIGEKIRTEIAKAVNQNQNSGGIIRSQNKNTSSVRNNIWGTANIPFHE